MTLVEFLTAASFRVTGGDEYGWDCFGPNSRFLDIGEKAAGVFDTTNRRVYAIEVFDKENEGCYRWIDPEFYTTYVAECIIRGVEHDIAWDDVRFTEVQSEIEILTLLSELISRQED